MTIAATIFRRYEHIWAVQVAPLWDAPAAVQAWLYEDGLAYEAYVAALEAAKELRAGDARVTAAAMWPGVAELNARAALKAAEATYLACYNARQRDDKEPWDLILDCAAEAIGVTASAGRVVALDALWVDQRAREGLARPLVHALDCAGCTAEAREVEAWLEQVRPAQPVQRPAQPEPPKRRRRRRRPEVEVEKPPALPARRESCAFYDDHIVPFGVGDEYYDDDIVPFGY